MSVKPFWKSKTLAGAVIALIALIYNIDLSEVGASELAGVFGALFAAYGRFAAKSSIVISSENT